MSLAEWIRRARLWIRRDEATAELEEEMRLHVDLRTDRLRAIGHRAPEAEARRRFGNVIAVAEASRAMWGGVTIDQLRQDIRVAWRRLWQRPGLSIPVIGVLALGIGATTAVFSAVDAAMFRPLPFPRAGELYTLPGIEVPRRHREDGEGFIGDRNTITIDRAAEMSDLFTGIAAFSSGGLNLTDPDRPQRLNVGVVTVAFFRVLGVQPIAGRTFSDDEGRPNGASAVILSYGFWQRQFGGAAVLDSTIPLQGKPYRVVGIMPPGFSFPQRSDAWIPMTVPLTNATFEPFRGILNEQIVARVRSGVSPREVSARLLARVREIRSDRPSDLDEARWRENLLDVQRRTAIVRPLQDALLGNRGRMLVVLLGATVLLLLIACANVANLLLSDATRRRREIAVREVLGASRLRIARQLLVESVMLSLIGAAVGLGLAPAALNVLNALVPDQLVGVAPAQLDLRVLGFAAALSVVTSLVFGLWPSFGATRGDATAAMKAGGDHSATAGGIGRVRGMLVAAEVALTIVLLVGAGLMLRSFSLLMTQDFGMNPDKVATMETTFPSAIRGVDQWRIVATTLARLHGQPGIIAAGAISDLPLRGGDSPHGEVNGSDWTPGHPEKLIRVRELYVTPGYFRAIGARLVRGRDFAISDIGTPGTIRNYTSARIGVVVGMIGGSPDRKPYVVIVNQTLAHRLFPGEDAVGKTVHGPDLGGAAGSTIVGVVSDQREAELESAPQPTLYRTMETASPKDIAFVARGTLPPGAFLNRLIEALHSAEPTQAVYNVRMMEDVISTHVTPRRTNTILIAVFAAIALLIASLGVYAVLAYGVTQRSREIGIRSALGATPRDIARLVSRDMVAVVAVGTLLGLGAALAVSRVVSALLYEIDAWDFTTFAVVPVVLLVPALLATIVPVVRAIRVDPTTVMRQD